MQSNLNSTPEGDDSTTAPYSRGMQSNLTPAYGSAWVQVKIAWPMREQEAFLSELKEGNPNSQSGSTPRRHHEE